MSKIPFICKKCGSETFKTTSEPKSLDDFDGAVCANCGTTITKDDIERQTAKIAEKAIKDALGGLGFK
jgi:hypothetical protein